MPASSNQIKREKLFNRYAQNWAFVQRHPNLCVDPKIEDAVVCPVCFQPFPRETLLDPEALTVEHVIPRKLGGTNAQCVLTCKSCNNNAGTHEDRLKQRLKLEDVTAGIPGTSIDGKYTMVTDGEEVWLPATLVNTLDGWNLIGDPKRSNPTLLNIVTSYEFDQKITGFRGRLEIPSPTDAHVANTTAFRSYGRSWPAGGANRRNIC